MFHTLPYHFLSRVLNVERVVLLLPFAFRSSSTEHPSSLHCSAAFNHTKMLVQPEHSDTASSAARNGEDHATPGSPSHDSHLTNSPGNRCESTVGSDPASITETHEMKARQAREEAISALETKRDDLDDLATRTFSALDTLQSQTLVMLAATAIACATGATSCRAAH